LTTTTTDQPAELGLLAHLTHPAYTCETCLSYLVDRLHVVVPHLVAIARRTDPWAKRVDWLVAGSAVSDELEAYVAKVHARHLDGHALDTPAPSQAPGLAPRPDGVLVTPDRRPCRKCRRRNKTRRTRHGQDHQTGDFQ
jgi:hypothetical protein